MSSWCDHDGPTIPARFPVHAQHRPTAAETFGRLMLVVIVALLLIGGLWAWAVQ